MAVELRPNDRAAFTPIIDEILAVSDLTTISAKRIRKSLQEKIGYDLTPHKSAVNNLINERFDRAQLKQESAAPDNQVSTVAPAASSPNIATPSATPPPITSASPKPAIKRKASYDVEAVEHKDVVDLPSAKKPKRKNSEVESDEKMAARLQAELNAQSARATRGGGVKRKAPVKKKSKAKSVAKLGSDDDSDLEGESGEKPERERKGGFHKPMNLSEPLSAMLGESQLSRPQTVKKIWQYVKGLNLQDPDDRRQIVCDEAMRAVFKSDRVHMFTMNKLLAHHLYPVDEV